MKLLYFVCISISVCSSLHAMTPSTREEALAQTESSADTILRNQVKIVALLESLNARLGKLETDFTVIKETTIRTDFHMRSVDGMSRQAGVLLTRLAQTAPIKHETPATPFKVPESPAKRRSLPEN